MVHKKRPEVFPKQTYLIIGLLTMGKEWVKEKINPDVENILFCKKLNL